MDLRERFLLPFLSDSQRTFSIRELARIVRTNPMTARAYLQRLEKEGFVARQPGDAYPRYAANRNRQFRNRKMYHTLELLRMSGLLEELDEKLDYPVIILFGSCAKGADTATSDIDICIITDVKKHVLTEKFEKAIGHPISLHVFSEKEWELLRKKNLPLRRNIQAGITLSDTAAS